MERLTRRDGNGVAVPMWSSTEGKCDPLDRLAACEDNAQTPEEQAAMIAQNKALQARIDEARADAAAALRALDGGLHRHAGDIGEQRIRPLALSEVLNRLRRIAADEPDAGDRLMQVQCGDARGRLQQTPEEPLPFTEE